MIGIMKEVKHIERYQTIYNFPKATMSHFCVQNHRSGHFEGLPTSIHLGSVFANYCKCQPNWMITDPSSRKL